MSAPFSAGTQRLIYARILRSSVYRSVGCRWMAACSAPTAQLPLPTNAGAARKSGEAEMRVLGFPAGKRWLSLSSCHWKVSRRRRTEKSREIVVDKHKIKSDKPLVEIYDNMTPRELAVNMEQELDAMMEVCLDLAPQQPQFYKIMENLDAPMKRPDVLLVVNAFDYQPKLVTRALNNSDAASLLEQLAIRDISPKQPPPPEECEPRPPVVTIMGHVDHGKTTLLDALRHSQIVQQEFGGITQHIGAFSVKLPNIDSPVTFLDTPGHAAFKAMRERGARCTDIVVLVVAADDSVMDQTVESIRYAKEAGVPIVVAINKCDKPLINTAKVREDLAVHGVVPEQLGGDTQVIEISALQKIGLDQLQEALLAQAEVMDLKATKKGLVEGIAIESTTAQGLGPVCTLIVHRGVLRKDATLVAGECWCNVRTMRDEHGKDVKEAGPSCPVQVSGWKDGILPTPGETILQVKNEQQAVHIVSLRRKLKREEKVLAEKEVIDAKLAAQREHHRALRAEKFAMGVRYGSSIRLVFHKKKENQFKKAVRDPNAPPVLALILRCDVEGSLEAILNVLDTYHGQEVKLDVVDFEVGPPREGDMMLAKDFDAQILCFNVPIPAAIREEAMAQGIPVEQFHVIYKLVNFVKDRLSEKLRPHTYDSILGEGHVLKEFRLADSSGKRQPIAGTMVDKGTFDKTKNFRILRGPQVIYNGQVMTLKHQEEFVDTIESGKEVGICLEDKAIRFKPGDRVQVYETIMTPRRIDWYPEGF